MYQKVTLSKLELSPNENNNIDITNKIKLKCDHCNKAIKRYGQIYVIPLKNIAVFFCSRKCTKLYKTNTVVRACLNCGAEIPKHGNRRYCSKACASIKFNKTFTCITCNKIVIDKSSRLKSVRKFCSKVCANRTIATKYKNYYFCDMCHDWIKKTEAKTMKTEIKTFKVCNKISCNNNKLRVRARRAKAKDKEARKHYYE